MALDLLTQIWSEQGRTDLHQLAEVDGTKRSTRSSQDCYPLWTVRLPLLSDALALYSFSARSSHRGLCVITSNMKPYSKPEHEKRGRSFSRCMANDQGLSGTHSQAVRTMGLRRTRYLGLTKTALQHVCTAAALNLSSFGCFSRWKKGGQDTDFALCHLSPR